MYGGVYCDVLAAEPVVEVDAGAWVTWGQSHMKRGWLCMVWYGMAWCVTWGSNYK